jgi:DNA-binding MarR family transcriptional regulator
MKVRLSVAGVVFLSVPNPDIHVFSTNAYLLQAHAASMLDALEEVLADLDISARQYVLLGVAADASSLSQMDIAQYIGVEPTVLGKLLLDLEARGYLVRQRSEEDRRRHELSLTDSGTLLFAKADLLRAQAEQEVLQHLSKSDQKALRSLLTKAM